MRHPLQLRHCLPIACLLAACGKEPQPTAPFDSAPQVRTITPAVDELSGLASSARYPGHLWGQEDSGNPSDLLLIREDGSHVRTVRLRGTVNRDWEEVARAGNDLYVADIGDNGSAYPDYRIYVLPEPSPGADTVDVVQTIRFAYPEGPRDAEAFLVDPVSRDVYILTKRDNPSRLYRIPAGATTLVQAEWIGTLPFTGVTAATLSGNGAEILVRGYSQLFYFTKNTGETIAQALLRTPGQLEFRVEPQGEAISFVSDGSGFVTGTEKAFGPAGQLYFYRRR